MTSTRHAIMAAASLLAAVAAAPSLVRADDQRPPRDSNGQDENSQRPGKGERNGQGDRGGRDRGQQHGEQRQGDQPRGPQEDRGRQRQGQQQERQQDRQQDQQRPQGERPQRQFGNKGPQDNPGGFGNNPMQRNPQRQQPVVDAPDRAPPQQQQRQDNAPQRPQAPQKQAEPQQQQEQPQQRPFDGKPKNFNNQFGGPGNDRNGNDRNGSDRNRPDNSKQFGGRDQGPNSGPNQQPNRPVVDNPGDRPRFDGQRGPFGGGGVPAQEQRRPLSADEAKRRFESMRGQRKEVKIDGGKGTVIEEPGNRRIIRENNRIVIQHDETERLRRVAPNARFEKGKGGTNVSIIERPGGIKVYSETDDHGQLLRRYRRGPDGRDVVIIDNRRRRGHDNGKNIAKGIGIGIGVVAGAAILNSVLDVPPPRVRIPREKYIVDYGRASDDDVYEALSAPPVDEFEDRYTLDEIRATAGLRDRMRRIDLDDINFEFGSWDVDPSQYRKLERIARGMNRIIDRNPNEVFMIEGYTDAVGSEEDNLSLSDRRAESVATVLTEEFGVPFENLTTQGYGEAYLKVPTQAAERLNRRVAVRRITPLLARDHN